MIKWLAVAAFAVAGLSNAADLTPPKAGKVDIFPLSNIKPGMQATAWTVFKGSTPEQVPIEILGIWKSAMGPNQDVILGKMGGKAKETNVAGGMSGSPVYIDGKLVGAVALRISVFSPDAICGITPIERMLEIKELDESRPAGARTPDKVTAPKQIAAADMPSDLLARVMGAGGQGSLPSRIPLLTPIETPLVFSGFPAQTLNEFQPFLNQMGITAVQGGAAATTLSAKPVAGWQTSLNPGETISGVLVSGDMSITGLGTVTYNDGKRVMGFGHQFFDLGPVDMPMAKGEIVMVLSSSYQPNKFGNTTDIVGALHQDRYSGILGELGAEAPTIPVHVKVRSLGENDVVLKEKDLHFNVFVQQKWTPFLMMSTLASSLQQMNEYADEMTYRMTGSVAMNGTPDIHVSTMLAPGEMPVPAPMVLAGWWGDKFNRLFLNSVSLPKMKAVEATIDMLPERRVATIENAWTADPEVEAGSSIPVKVFLRPYRGDRFERTVNVKIPAGMPKGDHRILFSDADTLNRAQSVAAFGNHYMDLPETVSLLNQERDTNKLYVSLVENRPTYFADDKQLPSLPSSMLNVLQTEKTTSRSLVGTPESAQEQIALPMDQVVSGSYSLKITVK